jgi:hypothetical protein
MDTSLRFAKRKTFITRWRLGTRFLSAGEAQVNQLPRTSSHLPA